MNSSWRTRHYEVMLDLLSFLNSKTDKFILKGGTSLLMCYGLDRFSEDLDFDGFDSNFIKYIDTYVKLKFVHGIDISYRVAKDTKTVKRVFIHYGGKKPLKVEVSYRKSSISEDEVCYINKILTYKIEYLFLMKLNAFNNRDKLRDLYDIVFIYRKYLSSLNSMLVYQLKDAVSHKGVEQFDYLITSQSDELIDNDKLAIDFLSMYYDLGLK